MRLKEWLQEDNSKWLLIFDNVDAAETMAEAWPHTTHGSILITSRDLTIAYGTRAKTVHVQPFAENKGSIALLSLLNTPASAENQELARKVVEALGGLPLAISQMGKYIVQRRIGLEKFLQLYKSNATKIEARGSNSGGYEHTLNTVWEVSLEQLPPSSSSLLRILAYLDPDKIQESVLLEGGKALAEQELEYLHDDMDLLDAEEAPLKAALIERSETDSSLKIHRLVQSAIRRRLQAQEKAESFDNAVTLLSNSFPNTWNQVTSHQYSSWSKYERCLPHTIFLIDLAKWGLARPTDPKAFSELIFRSCWYLYEREQYDEAQKHIRYGLELLKEDSTLMYASACTLQGLIELDILDFSNAVGSFLNGLRIRKEQLEPDDAFIASSLNALSIAYTETGDFDNAIKAGNQAIDIRLRTKSDRIGNSYSNMASTLLKMGKPDDAEEMLKRCPSLQEFTDETFLKTGNPRFSGDMVLLGRIRAEQGRLDDALRLLSKAVTFRRQVLGTGLKLCDALFHVAQVAARQGDLSLAATFLEESIAIAEDLPGAVSAGYLARSSFHAGDVLLRMGGDDLANSDRAERYRRQAKDAFAKTRKTQDAANLTEAETYDSVVHWMLW